MFFPECPNSIKLWKTESDRDLKKKTRALDCPMPLWNYAEMGGPKRYNEKLIKHKHLTSQQKSRPAKNFIVEAPEEGGRKQPASPEPQNHVFFFSDSIFSFGTLLNIPKPLAVVCIQPHKNLVEKSDVRSHHHPRDFLLGFLAST